MSYRGLKPARCALTAVKGAMQCAEVKPRDVARILGLPIERMMAILKGRIPFTVDQLARVKDYLKWCYREKGLLPKLAEKAERAKSDPRGLPEQFFRPQVTLFSCPGAMPEGGIWLMPEHMARRIDTGQADGLLHTILQGTPHYIYIVPMDRWEWARDHCEANGMIVLNRDAPEGWTDPLPASDLVTFGAEDFTLV